MKINSKLLLLASSTLLGYANCLDKNKAINMLQEYGNLSVEKLDDNKTSLRETIKILSFPHYFANRSDLNPSQLEDDEMKSISKDQYKFYRFKESNEEGLNAVIKFASEKSLEEIRKSESFKDLFTDLDEQVKNKAEFLIKVLKRNPSIKTIMDPCDSVFGNILVNEMMQFISDSVVFDTKRKSFIALHKSIEGISDILKVERKANCFIESITESIKNIDESKISNETTKNEIEFKFAMKKKDGAENNIIMKALKDANKSTSSADTLAYILGASLAVCSIMLFVKAFVSKSDKDEEEVEEEY